MESNKGKTLDEGDGPIMKWIIDYKKCNVCGECVDACLRGLLDIKDKKIIIINQYDCNWCGDCANACASDAIEFT